jgi:5-formyltetrahydrofolate cyclo-ligase
LDARGDGASRGDIPARLAFSAGSGYRQAVSDGADHRRKLRERLIAERMVLDEATYSGACDLILAALEDRFPPGALTLLGAYWPIRGEPDPMPYLERVLESGAAVALPAIVEPRQPLQFRPWTPTTPMQAGPLQIPHPAQGPSVTPGALLIPLVGFDAAGHRLGYGGGYYDRTLTALEPRPIAIGLGFELGRLATLRPATHDAAMDYIFTEAGLVVAPEGG